MLLFILIRFFAFWRLLARFGISLLLRSGDCLLRRVVDTLTGNDCSSRIRLFAVWEFLIYAVVEAVLIINMVPTEKAL